MSKLQCKASRFTFFNSEKRAEFELSLRFEICAPKGLEDSAQGFNPGNRPPRRRALKGRQIERPNKVEVGVQWRNCHMSQLRTLTFVPQSVRDSSRSRVSRPFRANHLF
jgi:hypothetical protein